eukprot:Skav204666  [mRNA]  locus=scaffold607:109415:121802:+ [translate_table: standard]
MEPTQDGQHGHAAVLQLHGPEFQDLLFALLGGDASRIPVVVSEGSASSCDALLRRAQGAQRTVGVQGPVAPSFAGQTVLEEHADDGHHCQSSVGDFAGQLLLPAPFRGLHVAVGNAQISRVLEVTRSALGIIRVLKELHGASEGHDLSPAAQGHFAEGCETIGHI